jgi:hypothetical protein
MLAAGAIDAVRNVSFFSLASVVIVGLAIDPVVAARWGDGMRLRPRINRAFATAALLIVLLAVITTVARNARVFEGASLRSVQAVVARAAAADPSIRILSDQKLADWLLWADPRLRGRVAFDVRFELLSDATMRALQRLYLAAGRHWKDQARGYRLLVLDAHDDPLSTQEFLTEPGRRILYHRSSTFVVLRSAAAAG